MNRKLAVIGLMTLTVIVAGGCTATTPAAVDQDRATAAASLDRLNDAQPVPEFRWSQIRQNLIEINRAQAETTQTTSFFFGFGSNEPVSSCPSIGFPIPTTAQLTNPQQPLGDIGHNGGGVAVPQVEQTGIYTGDSTGTYVVCVDAQGTPYALYWEGFVATVAGPAEWTGERIELVGPPSFEFTAGEGS